MSELKPLCIYHGNCADGFGAAWAVRRALGPDAVEFYAGVYQNDPPNAAGRHVIMVDFSYKRDVMIEFARHTQGVLLLDHHKSAMEDMFPGGANISLQHIQDLREYSGRLSWNRFLGNTYQDRCEGAPFGRIYALFDMNRSGAGMSWDFFHEGRDRPPLIDRIEDRDLWRFAYQDTRAIQASVFSYPYDFDTWDLLFKADLSVLRTEGEAIERKHHKDIAELVKAFRREMCIGGHWVPVANLPYTLTSDAGHLMCEPYQSPNLAGEWVTPPFAACYWDTPDGRVFSLRSRDDGMDVSEIAKQYGGGGHKHASGFRLSFDKARELEVTP
ncbi:MAG TPA: hypothetical protein VGD45_20525 [Steroidobacter sp.]|uniref:hypothetical protein n=1 Tax=Steroidobacter sp. TaxID=1978227 RepID=UPI002ED95108